MGVPNASFSVTVRLDATSDRCIAGVTEAVARAGGVVTALDVVESRHDGIVLDLTCNAIDGGHAERVADAIGHVAGVTVRAMSDRTFLIHLGGKIAVTPKIALKTRDDLSMAYTPGVARVCAAIAADPGAARNLTIKRNTVAVVTDGSAVLGLGDIGPLAALPVMEGKAALFKRFANVDAWPVCLATKDVDEIVRIVEAIAPVYGGINLEDIAAPRCFAIEARLRAALDIPVFHDDQHGTAIVVLAALTNALRVVDKTLDAVRVVVIGAGAAGSAITRLLLAEGVGDVVVCNRGGILDPNGAGLDPARAELARATNRERRRGDLAAAVAGADVVVGVSGPGVLHEAELATLASDAIVFALANPEPEVDPGLARRYAAVVATGRSDEPNQINNVLVFPGIFRGLLDAGATAITTTIEVAAARALAAVVADAELSPSYVVPTVFNPAVVPAVAGAVEQHARRA